MSTRYEVSYSNVWPSPVLDGRVSAQFTALLERLPAATGVSCHALFARPQDSGGLTLRVELTTGSGAIAAQRTLKTGRGEKNVCAAIDSVFADLGRLAPPVAGESSGAFWELAAAS